MVRGFPPSAAGLIKTHDQLIEIDHSSAKNVNILSIGYEKSDRRLGPERRQFSSYVSELVTLVSSQEISTCELRLTARNSESRTLIFTNTSSCPWHLSQIEGGGH